MKNHPFHKKFFVFVADNTNEPNKHRKPEERIIWKSIRRFTRETETQLIADGEYSLISGKGTKTDDFFYTRRSRNANRFKKKGLELKLMCDQSWNEGRKFSVLEFKPENYRCEKTFKELFQTPAKDMGSELYLQRSKGYEDRPDLKEKYLNRTFEEDLVLIDYNSTGNDLDDWDLPVRLHLRELFGNLPIYKFYERNIDRHNGTDPLGKCVISYSITHFGEDKKIISFKENYDNRKIYFWAFEDRIVFTYE